MASARIGFVGVGAMGMPMARRLVEAGHELTFTSRRDEAVEALSQAGAVVVPTPLVVAERSDIVMTCLPADSDLFQVYLGPGGIIERLGAGSTIIDLSTTSPMIMQRIGAEASARQIRVVDAPVSGGVWGAERGTLTIMAGCDPETFAAVRPLLAVLGSNIYHVGGVGLGKVFKIVNNLLTGTTMVLVGEALSLAANAGADLALLSEVIGRSSGNSAVWSDAVPKLLKPDDEAPGFRLELMRKDMGLAAALSEDLDTPAPLTALALQFYTAACARGLGRYAPHEVARLVARLAGADLVREDD